MVASGSKSRLLTKEVSFAVQAPTSVTIVENNLYVADVNNHAMRIVDLASGNVSILHVETEISTTVYKYSGGIS